MLDLGLWSRDERSALRWLATTAGAACQVIYLPIDKDVQRARISDRQATAPQTILVKMSSHVLRHTCATLTRDAGVRLEDVQDQLGHADPRTTRRYQHGGARLDRAPSYALAGYLAAG